MYRVLAYHRISNEGTDPLLVRPRDFADQLARLSKWGFSIVNLSELEIQRARRSRGRWAALTFDDGFEDNCTEAWPIIQAAGGSATFFVPTAAVGTSDHMTWPQLIDLADSGCEIGSHTRTHRELPGAEPEDLDDEIAGSRREIERELGRAVESFAYPRGLFDQRAKAAVRQAGYQRAVVTPRGAGHVVDRFTIERIGIYGHTSTTEFTLKVVGLYGQIKRTKMGARVTAARDARRRGQRE